MERFTQIYDSSKSSWIKGKDFKKICKLSEKLAATYLKARRVDCEITLLLNQYDIDISDGFDMISCAYSNIQDGFAEDFISYLKEHYTKAGEDK